jgi:hypothetical protein
MLDDDDEVLNLDDEDIVPAASIPTPDSDEDCVANMRDDDDDDEVSLGSKRNSNVSKKTKRTPQGHPKPIEWFQQSNYYEIFGLERNKFDEQKDKLSKAYRTLALVYHPDANTTDDAVMKILNHAKSTLCDTVERAKYNLLLDVQEAAAEQQQQEEANNQVSDDADDVFEKQEAEPHDKQQLPLDATDLNLQVRNLTRFYAVDGTYRARPLTDVKYVVPFKKALEELRVAAQSETRKRELEKMELMWARYIVLEKTLHTASEDHSKTRAHAKQQLHDDDDDDDDDDDEDDDDVKFKSWRTCLPQRRSRAASSDVGSNATSSTATSDCLSKAKQLFEEEECERHKTHLQMASAGAFDAEDQLENSDDARESDAKAKKRQKFQHPFFDMEAKEDDEEELEEEEEEEAGENL